MSAAVTSASQRTSLRAKAALALEVVGAYVHVRLLLRRAPLPAVLDNLRTVEPGDAARDGLDDPFLLARAVRRTLAVLPFDGRCLAQSLVLTRMLSRRGIASELVIGVVPGDAFAAHAWIESGRAALLPLHEREFETLARL
jgi:Transglutaminase-like superfamily